MPLMLMNFIHHTAANYQDIVSDPLKSCKTIVCNMYLEIHFLNSHLDFFPENLGTISDKNEEHFHQDISNMKSGTMASAAQVCWQTTTEPSWEMLHRQNTAENQPFTF
jgi:hypothetical protein